jgi:hypothetical protein
MSFKVDPASSTVDGKTISDWTKDWWRWLVDGPREPFNQSDDTTGLLAYIHNDKSVFFLAGNDPFSGAASNATRTILVPHGKPVLVPLLNSIDIEGPGITNVDDTSKAVPGKADLQSTARDSLTKEEKLWEPDTMKLTVDGRSIADLQGHLEKTDFFSVGKITPGSFLTSDGLNAKPGAVGSVSLASGYFVMLDNLSRGFHTVSFSETLATDPKPTNIAITDHLLVV